MAVQVAVVGSGVEHELAAEEVGRLLAEAGHTVVTGGLDEVMAAAHRGAKGAGGTTIAVLPGEELDAANPWADHVVATGIGHARNLAVAASGDAVIAVGGSWGTLSEIAFALRLERPVVCRGRRHLPRPSHWCWPPCRLRPGAERDTAARRARFVPRCVYRPGVRLLLAASAALVLAVSVALGSALAAFPGANGVIAFVVASEPTGRSGTITTIRGDGSGRRVIGRGADPAWSPDGDRLLFATTRDGVRGLFTTTPAGHDLRRVGCASCADPSGAPRPVELFDAEWSPDGDTVAASRSDSVVVEDITTGLDGEAGFDPSVTIHEDCGAGCLSGSSPAWSPDGSRIAFAYGDAGGDGGTVVGKICLAPSTGGVRRCITAGIGRPATGLGGDSVPDWSPDGRLIAFQRFFACAGGTCRSAIQVVRPNGTGLRRIVADGAMPAWSPDGTRLLFVRLSRASCGDPVCRRGLWTVRLDGTGLRRVTSGRRDVFPDWQPR